MTDRGSIPDEESRIAAATTFDRNVIVIAGAGTGKTTLLVNRLLHLLMREPAPVEMLHIVALTFTNKAAAEMKIRLREGLHILANGHDPHAVGSPGSIHLADLQQRYGLSASQIAARAEAALRDLEKAQIGTLHSFAAHLLRLYPIEAGVDPHFQTDEDETVFESHFTERWERWLDLELGASGTDTGLGFDAALGKVVEKLKGPLSDEFRRALAEVRVGKARRDALRDIVPRTEVGPLTNFIGAIIQAEQLGVSVSKVLQVQSEQLRIERRQRAEEQAAKAPIKMLFPLVGCIFPSLFIVILGPAIILIVQNLAS